MVACTPVTSALGRLRQEDCKFKESVGCILCSRPAWVTQKDPISKKSFILNDFFQL
jgi:hypothetical protein